MTTLEKREEKVNQLAKKIKIAKDKIDKKFGHEIIRSLDLDYASLTQKEMARTVYSITLSLHTDVLTKNN